MWCLNEGIGLWSWFGGLWVLVFGGGFIALVVWGVSRLTRHNSMAAHNSSYDVVKQRYARGELSREEFEQIKRDLS